MNGLLAGHNDYAKLGLVLDNKNSLPDRDIMLINGCLRVRQREYSL